MLTMMYRSQQSFGCGVLSSEEAANKEIRTRFRNNSFW
jgi:hypothetical protein